MDLGHGQGVGVQGGDAFLGDAQDFGKAGLPGIAVAAFNHHAGGCPSHGVYLRGLFRSC